MPNDKLREIKEEYRRDHDYLTDCYYNRKPYDGKVLTKEEFDEIHSSIYLDYQKAETELLGADSDTVHRRYMRAAADVLCLLEKYFETREIKDERIVRDELEQIFRNFDTDIERINFKPNPDYYSELTDYLLNYWGDYYKNKISKDVWVKNCNKIESFVTKNESLEDAGNG